MATQKLTKRFVEGLPAAKEHIDIYYDSDVRGFCLCVYNTGRKYFYLQYGNSVNRKRMLLGVFGEMTVEQAREEAGDFLREYRKGTDPLQQRKAEKNAQKKKTTFQVWAKRYVEEVTVEKKSPREDIRYLGWAIGWWGQLAVNEITRESIEKRFRSLSRERSNVVGNRWLASVRACLQEAWRRDIIESNPAMKVRPNKEPPGRKRVLSDAEFAALGNAIHGYHDQYARSALILLTETGARLSEVLHAKWEDFNFDANLWTLPSTKSGKEQIMPIDDDIATMLQSLPREGEFVIKGEYSDRPRSDLKRPWTAVLKESGIKKKTTIHDLRRTFCVQVARTAGIHLASKLLRHSDIRVTENHYAPADIEDEREALKKRRELINPRADRGEPRGQGGPGSPG